MGLCMALASVTFELLALLLGSHMAAHLSALAAGQDLLNLHQCCSPGLPQLKDSTVEEPAKLLKRPHSRRIPNRVLQLYFLLNQLFSAC